MKLRKFWFYFWLVIEYLIFTSHLDAQILENFENGDLSKWRQIPAGHWKISNDQALAGTKSLRQWSDSIFPTEDRISISLAGLAPEQDTVCYRFRLKHGSNPSSSNRWAVYLAYDEDAEQMLPGAAGNGYMLGVNMNSADDNLKFFKVSNGSLHEILNTKFNWETSVGILHAGAIDLKRAPGGNWSVYLDKTGSFDSLKFY